MEVQQVFFKVLLSNNIRCLVKTVGENVKVSKLKQEVLFGVGFSEESHDDFYLLNITSGQPVTESQCFTCNHMDVIILTKKTNPENLIFSDTSLENIGSSFHQLSAERMDLGDQQKEVLELDGETLDYKKLFYIGQRKYFIKLSKAAREKIIQSRNAVDDIVRKGQKVYGINTGFGKFKDEVIDQDKVKELQENLILSHACGVSKPFTLMVTRMVMALRINVLAKGCSITDNSPPIETKYFSGIRLSTLEKIVKALNADCLPYIPEKGSVGASGDLAPLSHLAIGLMGYGQMWSPKTGWGDASEILKFNGLQTLDLEAKEGLAINNGTQVIAALGAEALFRADMIAKQADIIAALTTEVLEGVPGQFDKDIHELRPHPGQILTAARLRQLLHASEGPSNGKTSTVSPIIQGRLNRERGIPKTQDPYSIRCTPQVHGIVHETVAFTKAVLNTEINSATDNPLVLLKRSENKIASAGNFHGEYPGMALDQLAIAIQEIASISERRIERLVHPDYLKDITATGLPGFLVGEEPGLNNGFMILQYTAAALVSENKVLSHPSTVDSITTSGGSEDHVSMGTFAARKAVTVVENVENVLAIELLAACQALDLHKEKGPGITTTPPLEKVHMLVRQHTKMVKRDHYMAPDIAACARLLQEGKIWEEVQSYFTDECKRSLELSYK